MKDLLGRFLCKVMGWHWVAPNARSCAGISEAGNCYRCGCRCLCDSNGDWFEVAPPRKLQ